MTAKEHYETHLGNIYSWMTGDFNEKQAEQQNFFESHRIYPKHNGIAFDLGAGHGLQTVSLAKLGFKVTAVDFNEQLLSELQIHSQNLNTSIDVTLTDLLHFLESTTKQAELIICMGDTLTHLTRIDEVRLLLELSRKRLVEGGKIVLSFRDLTQELTAEQRFIPVRSDESRIHTCFLEYFADRVMVHDIVHEKSDGKWKQKISAYPKLRVNEEGIRNLMVSAGLTPILSSTLNRMIYLIGEKSS